MTQTELSELTGLKQTTISAIETGTNAPAAETVRLLVQVLGCTSDDLLGTLQDRTKPDKTGQNRTKPDQVLTQEETALLQIFRQLTPSGRTIVMATAEATLRQADMRQESTTPSAM